jgi:C1A family cysteine protease
MKSFVALTLAAVASAIDSETFEFMQFVSKHGRNYSSLAEFNMRLELFTALDKEIKEWNATPGVTSQMGHNFLSDWTYAEKLRLRGLNLPHTPEEPTHFAPEGYVKALSTFDWCDTTNSKNVNECSPIKNQGACGGCWAFSATETVESAISIFHDVHPVIVLSPQQLISCSSAYGNHGCGGGWYYYAWNYMKNNAQETEADYPYSNQSYYYGVTGACTADTSKGVVKTASDDYVVVGHTNDDIMSAIDRQPVSVAIDASSSTFQNYKSGIITSGCGTSIDHAVVAVGYGTENGEDYFLVRNSWGTGWGDAGFVKIGQSSNNSTPGYCAINTDPYYPNIVYPL